MIESNNNRTKFYLKRYENEMKSIQETTQKTEEEIAKVEKHNTELGI